MLSAGVLLSQETEFGDLLIRINHDAVKWKATSDVENGDRSLVSHVQWRKPSQHPKLSLMMHLCSKGWLPMLKGPAAGYYSAGDEQHFLALEGRPKTYFAVLCQADEVLQRLAISDESIPLIYHSMPDAYYRLLLRVDSSRSVQALLDLIGSAPNVEALTDKNFKELLPACDDGEGSGDDAGEEDMGLPALKDMVPAIGRLRPTDADIAQSHRIAKQVLSGIPASMVDIKTKWCRRFGGRDCYVHFDNCSHASGRQRAWIGCPHKFHHACFKYVYIDTYESPRECAAWLVEWSEHARGMPIEWSKQEHLRFRPPEEAWRLHMDEMREDA